VWRIDGISEGAGGGSAICSEEMKKRGKQRLLAAVFYFRIRGGVEPGYLQRHYFLSPFF
jgi:hypothetical protein